MNDGLTEWINAEMEEMEEMTDEVGGGKQATLSVWMVLQPT